MEIAPVTAGTSCSRQTCSSAKTVACSSDWPSTVSSTFGTKPYLVVKSYTDSYCSSFDYSLAIPVDGSCHPLSDTSSVKLAINADDGTVSISSYGTSASCASTPVTWSLASNDTDTCNSFSQVFSVGNYVFPTPKPTTAAPPLKAIYSVVSHTDGISCLVKPNVVIATPSTAADCRESACKVYGASNRTTTSYCTTDYQALINSLLGSRMYTMKESFRRAGCANLSEAIAATPDRLCHNYVDRYGSLSSIRLVPTINAHVTSSGAFVRTQDVSVSWADYTNRDCVGAAMTTYNQSGYSNGTCFYDERYSVFFGTDNLTNGNATPKPTAPISTTSDSTDVLVGSMWAIVGICSLSILLLGRKVVAFLCARAESSMGERGNQRKRQGQID